MHVDDHQALAVLGQDVDALQLRQRAAQGPGLVVRRRRGPGGGCAKATAGEGCADAGAVAGGDVAGGSRRSPGHIAAASPRPRSAAKCIAGCVHAGTAGALRGLKKGSAGAACSIAGARRGQRVLDRMAHRLVHLAPVAEAHLDLGRMHVDVDPRRIDLEVQRVDRLALAVQHVLVGAAHRVRQHLVAHEAAVDVEELLVGPRARGIGNAGAAASRAPARRHARPPRSAPRSRRPACRPGAARAPSAARHCSTSLPSCQTAKPTSGRASAWRRTASMQWASSVASVFRNLRRAGVAKNSSRTSTVVPVARATGRSSPVRPSSAKAPSAPADARQQAELGDGVDGGQRLAAKAHGAHGLQVAEAGDLAGGVAAQRQRQFVARQALAVVLDRDQAHAAGREPHRDLARAGVERVVEQLAHHRGRPLHHFAGGDLADQFVGEFADGAARGRGEGRGKGAHAVILEGPRGRGLHRG